MKLIPIFKNVLCIELRETGAELVSEFILHNCPAFIKIVPSEHTLDIQCRKVGIDISLKYNEVAIEEDETLQEEYIRIDCSGVNLFLSNSGNSVHITIVSNEKHG